MAWCIADAIFHIGDQDCSMETSWYRHLFTMLIRMDVGHGQRMTSFSETTTEKWWKGLANVFRNFIRGLVKSFDGKDHLRDLKECKACGKPSFFSTCLKCEMDELYKGR